MKFMKLNLSALISFLLYCLPYLNGASSEAYAQIFSSMTQKSEKIVGSLLKAENVFINKNFKISENYDFLTCQIDGVYFVTSSIQVAALNLGINGHLGMWFEVNHKPLSASTARLYVTENAPISLLTTLFLIKLKKGDTIGTRVASSGPDIGITYIDAPSSIEPSIPSYTFVIYKVNDL